ncbi:hypothetical protein E2I00_001560, partial [Balaenoptera physalus]
MKIGFKISLPANILHRVHLIERKKAERKVGLLEKKLAGVNRFTPYMSMKEQEDSFMTRKIWDKCQQDLIHKEKQLPELHRPPYSFSWETKTEPSLYQKFLSQLSTLPSNSVEPIPATEKGVKESIQETGANERSWKSISVLTDEELKASSRKFRCSLSNWRSSIITVKKLLENHPILRKSIRNKKRPLKHLEGKIAINDLFPGRLDLDTNKENSQTKISQMEHGKTFKQLEKDNKQETLLNIQQNLKVVTTQRLEEKIHKLQKQLSDLKLSNENMKTQLTRVNVLKKLRQSLTKAEAMKGKAVMETDLKTTVDSAEQDVRWDKERAHQMLETVTPELCTAKSTLEEVPGQQEELVDFRETIMKMLAFNMKTADKKIINHLRLIIQVYEASDKSKIASASARRLCADLAFVWAGNQLERESALRWRGRGRSRGAVSRETILAGAGGQRGRRAQGLCWSVLARLPRGELGGRRAGRQGIDLQSVGRRPALSLPGSDKDEALLAKNFERYNIFHFEGPKDGQKIWDKCRKDLIHKEKQISESDTPLCSFHWKTKTVNSVVPIPAMEEAVKKRIQEIGANEPSWKS